MTREEAVKILQGAIKKPNTKDGYLGQAIEMAIGALEVEPCGDAISREATLMCMTGVNLLSKKPEELISLFDKRIKALPSVTPRQKTGEWIKLKDQPPKKHVNVLVKDIEGFVTCAFLPYTGLNFLENFSGEIIDDVVEWMELPAPYKVESEDEK